MKLIATASLLGSTTMANTFNNVYGQHRSINTANHLVKKLNMITERRIFPELVSVGEAGFSQEQQDEYEGHYAMQQPNVNFLLDFGNEELVKFRVHTQTYQQKDSYLDDAGWGAKKSGYGSSVLDDEDRNQDEWYKKYQDNNLERFTRPTRANLLRRIASQEMMIQYVSKTKRRFGAFFNYGCHCFPGSFVDPRHSPHAAPVDDIDKACREHSWAYDCAKQDFGHDCRGKYQLYNWMGTIAVDGFRHEITCTDEVNTCAWAICEADKHLAESLADLNFGYSEELLVNPQNGKPGFDRPGMCNLQKVEETVRDSHNFNENVYLNDVVPAAPAAAPVNEVPVVQSASQVPVDDMFLPPQGILSPSDLSAERGIQEMGAFEPVAADNNFGNYEPAVSDVGGPDWGSMSLEERRKWADAGWEIPEEYKEPKEPEEEYYEPAGNLMFGLAPSGPQEPQFASISEQPAFTHDSTEAPATVDELNTALQAVVDVASNQDSQLYADNAHQFDNADANLQAADVGVEVESVAAAAPAVAEVTNEEPVVIMKAAVTHHYRKCCGSYPRRYKYSSDRMGCCNDRGLEKLYSPNNSKCCHVKSARGVQGSMASYLARIHDDCDDAFNN